MSSTTIIDAHIEEIELLFVDLDAYGHLEEAEELIDEIQIELHVVRHQEQRLQYADKLRTYRQLVEDHRRRKLSSSRQDLPRPRVETSMEVLRQARRELADTELIAESTAHRLRQQRDTIEHANRQLAHTQRELGHTNQLLKRLTAWWRG